jgi:hypothetical protein
VFDFYATSGASDDIFHIGLNAFKLVVERCQLAEADNTHLNLGAFDRMFVAVTAGKKGDNARALNRQEWLQVLIRFAKMRHVATGRADTIAIGLRNLIDLEMGPRVDARAVQNSRTFREDNCYLQDVDLVLQTYAASLRNIYKSYSKGTGAIGDELDSTKLLSFPEFKLMLRDLELFDDGFSAREAALAFSWSRMRVIDPDKFDSKVQVLQLRFEDFLEALVRIATMKALPDDEMIYDEECEDGGEVILKLRTGDPMDYKEFIARSTPEFGKPLHQPIERLVEHLCTLILRTITSVVASAGSDDCSIKDMEALTYENVRQFRFILLRQSTK